MVLCYLIGSGTLETLVIGYPLFDGALTAGDMELIMVTWLPQRGPLFMTILEVFNIYTWPTLWLLFVTNVVVLQIYAQDQCDADAVVFACAVQMLVDQPADACMDLAPL